MAAEPWPNLRRSLENLYPAQGEILVQVFYSSLNYKDASSGDRARENRSLFPDGSRD